MSDRSRHDDTTTVRDDRNGRPGRRSPSVRRPDPRDPRPYRYGLVDGPEVAPRRWGRGTDDVVAVPCRVAGGPCRTAGRRQRRPRPRSPTGWRVVTRDRVLRLSGSGDHFEHGSAAGERPQRRWFGPWPRRPYPPGHAGLLGDGRSAFHFRQYPCCLKCQRVTGLCQTQSTPHPFREGYAEATLQAGQLVTRRRPTGVGGLGGGSETAPQAQLVKQSQRGQHWE